MFLVDTNVLSAGAPDKAVPGLAGWMERHSDLLYLSAITVAEVQEGICKAQRQGATRKADVLTEWLETVLHLYRARILAVDCAVGLVLGRLSDRVRGSGHAPGLADLAVAATALTYGHTVLTRNLRHFLPMGVPAHDLFESLPVMAGPTG